MRPRAIALLLDVDGAIPRRSDVPGFSGTASGTRELRRERTEPVRKLGPSRRRQDLDVIPLVNIGESYGQIVDC